MSEEYSKWRHAKRAVVKNSRHISEYFYMEKKDIKFFKRAAGSYLIVELDNDNREDVIIEIALATDPLGEDAFHWEIPLAELVDYMIDNHSISENGKVRIPSADEEEENRNKLDFDYSPSCAYPILLAQELRRFAERLETALTDGLDEKEFD